jgi:AAHS family 4-hydroxybenzoate transporter-like MFS transporter
LDTVIERDVCRRRSRAGAWRILERECPAAAQKPINNKAIWTGEDEMSRTVHVESEIEHSKITGYHRLLIGIICLIMLFDGYDTFAPAYVIHYVMKPWGLTPSSAGLLVSSGLIGFMGGAFLQGAIADRFGRKPTLLAALFLSGVFNIATAGLGTSFDSFIAFRVLTGLCLGVLLPLGVTYINEFCPRRISNLMATVAIAGFSTGGIIVALTGIAVTPQYGWECLFWIGAVAMPLSILIYPLMPESPQFLALHNRQELVRKVLTRLNPRTEYHGVTILAYRGTSRVGSISELLTTRYRRTTIVLWVCSACTLFSIYFLSSWIPTLMLQRGESFASSFLLGGLLNGMAVVGGLLQAWTADRSQNRKQTLIGVWSLGILSILGLAMLNGPITNWLFVAGAGFFTIGSQILLNNLAAHSYETAIRATGVGMLSAVGRIGGILGPFIGGVLQQLFAGTDTVLLSLVIASAASVCAMWLLRPVSMPSPIGGSSIAPDTRPV